jgi:hypothetical protein
VAAGLRAATLPSVGTRALPANVEILGLAWEKKLALFWGVSVLIGNCNKKILFEIRVCLQKSRTSRLYEE